MITGFMVITFSYVVIDFSYTGKWIQTQTTLADKAKKATQQKII